MREHKHTHITLDFPSEPVISFATIFLSQEKNAENFGQFYFRRPNAESSADVFDRVGAFVGSLRRKPHHL